MGILRLELADFHKIDQGIHAIPNKHGSHRQSAYLKGLYLLKD